MKKKEEKRRKRGIYILKVRGFSILSLIFGISLLKQQKGKRKKEEGETKEKEKNI